jgi:hypothetical protein
MAQPTGKHILDDAEYVGNQYRLREVVLGCGTRTVGDSDESHLSLAD